MLVCILLINPVSFCQSCISLGELDSIQDCGRTSEWDHMYYSRPFVLAACQALRTQPRAAQSLPVIWPHHMLLQPRTKSRKHQSEQKSIPFALRQAHRACVLGVGHLLS